MTRDYQGPTQERGSGAIITDLPRDKYDDHPGLNASAIVAGIKSMKHMHHQRRHDRPDTAAMRWGRLAHMAMLEPARAAAELVTFDGAKRGKAWTEFKAENESKEIITVDEAERLATMTGAIASHDQARSLLADCQMEASAVWTHPEYGQAKARIDGLNANHIVELKTTGSATIQPEPFRNQSARLSYHVRAGWYVQAVGEITGRDLPVYVICVEADPPHDIVIYEMDEIALAAGRDVSFAIAKRYRECERTGTFPGVCDEIRTLRLPEWLMKGDDPVALRAVKQLEEMEAITL